MNASLTRRAAIGAPSAVLGAMVLPVGSVSLAAPVHSEAGLIAQARAVQALRVREQRAWRALSEDAPDDGPEVDACRRITDDLMAASEALADMPATTAAGLGAKAAAMLVLLGSGRARDADELAEHDALVEAVLRDAVRLGTGDTA